MENDIVRVDAALALSGEPTYFMPIVDVKRAIERREIIKSFTANVMVDGQDYGTIPGTGKRKTLLKPGAEKLTSFFGMIPEFQITREILDFDGTGEGNGEPLIYYRLRCDLYRAGVKVGSADASCSSREGRYRWRTMQRQCPTCGKDTIRKGSEQYGGGWYCDRKADGCGAKFDNGDPRIENQVTGKSANPDIADLDNTILKMAEKRSLVAATLIATNVSDFFTQDVEDMIDPAVQLRNPVNPVSPTVKAAPAKAAQAKPASKPAAKPAEVWHTWTSPVEAYKWAVKESYASTEADASGAFRALVQRDFGGKLTASNHESVYAAYVALAKSGDLFKGTVTVSVREAVVEPDDEEGDPEQASLIDTPHAYN